MPASSHESTIMSLEKKMPQVERAMPSAGQGWSRQADTSDCRDQGTHYYGCMLPGVRPHVSNTSPYLQGMRNRTRPEHITLHAHAGDAADAHLLMVLARGPTAQPASSLSESLSRALLRLRGAPLPAAAAPPPLPPRPCGPRWGAALPAAGGRLPARPPRCPVIAASQSSTGRGIMGTQKVYY